MPGSGGPRIGKSELAAPAYTVPLVMLSHCAEMGKRGEKVFPELSIIGVVIVLFSVNSEKHLLLLFQRSS